MGDPAAKKRVQQAIKERVKPKADAAAQAIAAAVPELHKTMTKVEAALKTSTAPALLLTYRRELTIRMRAVNAARTLAVDALEILASVAAKDDDFAADAEEIEALQARLTSSTTLLAKQLVKAKDAETRAGEAAAKADKSEANAHREWDLLVTGYEAAIAGHGTYMDAIRKRATTAEKAVVNRDAKELEEQQFVAKKMMPIAGGVLQVGELAKQIAAWVAKYDVKGFSEEFRAEMAKDRSTTIVQFEKSVKALDAETRRISDSIQKLRIVPRDAVKSTAVLGFKANFISRVEAVLELDDAKLAKALEDLAKTAGVKATGKELVELLKKAKLR